MAVEGVRSPRSSGQLGWGLAQHRAGRKVDFRGVVLVYGLTGDLFESLVIAKLEPEPILITLRYMCFGRSGLRGFWRAPESTKGPRGPKTHTFHAGMIWWHGYI